MLTKGKRDFLGIEQGMAVTFAVGRRYARCLCRGRRGKKTAAGKPAAEKRYGGVWRLARHGF